MGTFLNNRIPLEAYKSAVSGRYFVDKSRLIEELLPALGTEERFYCVTRPRRFGKSIMANMVGAFFGKGGDAGSVFSALEISNSQ